MFAFSNPEYMSFDDLAKLTAEYKLKQTPNSKLGPPPSKPPAPPPKTPPAIRHRKAPPPPPLYQNVNTSPSNSILLSEISSSNSSSSNATMIVRKSPPQSMNTNSLYEEDDDEVCSMILNDLRSPPPRMPVNKLNTPRIINRLSLNESRTASNPQSDRRRSMPDKTKRMDSISPIMTSSRADLNSVTINNQNRNFYGIFNGIQEEMNVLEPTIINSPPPPPQMLNFNSLPHRSRQKFETHSLPKQTPKPNCFNNVNYYCAAEPNSNSSSDEQMMSDDSIESSLCSLVLQPPSPFKSPNSKQPSIIARKPGHTSITKKVSFQMQVNMSTSPTDSLCSSLSSTSSSDLAHGQVQELDLIKEKIFSKIFSNEDYFVSDLLHKIESASASSCGSSTSSASSGYKSNQSSGAFQQQKLVKNQSSVELNEFIATNRDRLDRLKVKRTQLIGFN